VVPRDAGPALFAELVKQVSLDNWQVVVICEPGITFEDID
jgi:hypothetical protein